MTYVRNEKGEFVCPDCGVTKVRQNTMFYHMKKHTGEMSHICNICTKGFIQKSGLTQHMLQAHPSPDALPSWNCPCCNHTARMKANLLIHIGRMHGTGWIPSAESTGEVNCTGCKRAFASPTSYYYHAVQCFTPPNELQEKIALMM